jgi:hypothetical protein
MSLACDECSSRTIRTFPLGFLGRKQSFIHAINISDVTYVGFLDIIMAEPGGKHFSNSFLINHFKIAYRW